MTPMIDVIFQLLLFFVFSLKFVAFEGQLEAYLPKDRGINAASSPTLEAIEARLELEWDPSDGGKAVCWTVKYVDPQTGQVTPNYQFPMEDQNVQRFQRNGKIMVETEAIMKPPGSPDSLIGKVTYDYQIPRFDMIEAFVAHRKQEYDTKQGSGPGLPVTVSFDDGVPWQVIANILDICTRLRITNFSLSAKEIEN